MYKQGNQKTKSEKWIKLQSKSRENKNYYYNPFTKESRWTIPDETQCIIEENSKANQHKGQSKKRKFPLVTDEEKIKLKCNEFSLSDKEQLKVRKKDEIDIKNSNYQSKILLSPSIVTNNSPFKLNSSKSLNTTSINNFKIKQTCDTFFKKKMEVDSIARYTTPNLSKESSASIKSNKLNCLNVKNDKLQNNNYSALETVNTDKNKTLAQTRLLNKKMEYKAFLEQKTKLITKKKEQNLEIIKDHEIIDFNNSSNFKKRFRLAADKNDEPYESVKDIPSSSNDIVIVSDISNDTADENMDWEPLEEEIMIKHINCIRKNLDTEAELSLDIAVCSSRGNECKSDSSKLILIFDTNIFISCLPFVKDIRDKFILDLGLPFFYIPWRVLQELDHLKNSKESQINRSARKAIQYINDNFVEQHPRVYGQTLDEFSSTLNSEKISDDEILAACLHLKGTDYSKRVILVTNDKNLESKALMSKVEAYSKDRLLKNFTVTSKSKGSELATFNNLKENSISEIKYDVLYCQLKDILMKFLEPFLRCELRSVYKEHWETIVRKKPPWSLVDIFNCLTIHWIAIFKFLFPQETFQLINELKEFFDSPKIEDNQIFKKIAMCKEFLMYLKSPENINKSYMKDLEETILKIELIEHKDVKDHNNMITMRCEETPNSSLMSNSFESSNFPASYNSEMSSCDYEMCKEKVKSLFKTICSKIKNYFCEISGLLQHNGSNDVKALNEIKWQFQFTIHQIDELLLAINVILSLKYQEAHGNNQVVSQFINYLLNIFKLESSELNNLQIGMIIFCREDEGRSVLEELMNDLKMLGMKMVSMMTAFEQPWKLMN